MGFPVVDTVTPTEGPKAGGTSVTIVGRNFTGVTSVSFDGIPAASFAVVDDNTITAVTPAGTTAGDIDVDLVNADGTSAGGVILNDSSGNANNGTYTSHVFVPGLVPGGDAGSPAAFQVAHAIIDPTAAFTVEYWASSIGSASVGINAAPVGDPSQFLHTSAPVTDGANDGVVQVQIQGVDFAASFNSEADINPTPFPPDGDPHLVDIIYEPSGTDATISLYIDGTFIASQLSSPNGAGTGSPFALTTSGATGAAAIDELAFFPTALSSGDIAANFAAAAVSYAAYKAQILSLSPTGYYRFDDDRNSGEFTYLGAEGWHVGRIGVGAI